MLTRLPEKQGAIAGWHLPWVRPVASLIASFMLAICAATPGTAGSRHAAMAIDANTGETLHAESADELRHPASLTKMMTIYMAFEQLEAGRLLPGTKLKVSQEAALAAPTKLDLESGEQIAVMDAIKALITKSANDMAIVLAEAIGGTEIKFAELMTQKARLLGMRNTTFRNASGLPDNQQVTTARDMLTLAMRLQDDFPKLYPLFATGAFSYNGATHKNHNTLLGTFEGIDGIKTGYTRMSGFNIVTSMRRGEKHIVAAVFGGATAGTRNATMRLVLTRALLKASTNKTRKLAPVLIARPKLARPQKVASAAPPAAIQPVVASKSGKSSAVPIAKTPVTQPKTIAAVAPVPVDTPTIETVMNSAPAAGEPDTEVAAADVDPTPAAEPAIPIQIAKVRPVMVALRSRPARPSPEEAPALNERSDTATPAMSAAAAAIGKAPDRPASQLIAFAQPAIAPPAAAAAPIMPPAPVVSPIAVSAPQAAPLQTPVIIQKGNPPSTLQAQAQGLSRSPAVAPPAPMQVAYATLPAPSRLRGPEAASATKGGFHVQVGAYASAAEAEKALKSAQARSNDLLKSAAMVTSPVQKENRLLYRARFAGFDARRAADTCIALRRIAIDCFVMKAD